MHSASAASRLAALLVARIFPIFLLLAPCQPGALAGPIPMTIAIDRAGAVVERHAGRAGKDRFIAMLRKALGE
ncbi:MAG: hypothetical protein IMZ44_16700 [Planctomycetes bacterium]|nr:hypothetical protein [Planctomycetota bacterium]